MTDPRSEQPYFEPSEEPAPADPLAALEPQGRRAESSPDTDGDAGGYFGVTTEAKANEALAYFAQQCSNCQWEERCPGETCAIYRAEEEAIAVLRATPVVAGVPLRPDIT